MNKLSKLTALLLALVLALSVPMQVMAEDSLANKVIETFTQYLETADNALINEFLSVERFITYLEMTDLIDDEAFLWFYNRLTEEEKTQITAYLTDLMWASSAPFSGVVGPFLSAVYVDESASMTYALRAVSKDSMETFADDADADVEGLVLKKTAVPNNDEIGSYRVTLETYVEGIVTTTVTTTSNPCDIILVLDMSSSMKETLSGSTSRFSGLKTAVTNFANEVYTKAAGADATLGNADDVAHRISIIEFWNGYDIECPLKDVSTTAGQTAVTDAIGDLATSQGTVPADGLNAAIDVFNGTGVTNDTVAAGDRQRVVVFFTDGYPSTTGSSNFTASYANDAITAANTLKKSTVNGGCGATVFSVAVLADADPTVDISGVSNSSTNAVKVNAFLHAVSSNYPNATASSSNNTFNITLGTQASSNYYLTASNTTQLNNIFTTISQNIQSSSSSVELTETAIVKDVISPYFQLPVVAGTEDVDLTTANIMVQVADHTADDSNGNPLFGDAYTPSPALFATISGSDNKTLEVTGFDFAENAVSTTTNKGVTTYNGKKLIISFNVVPEEGFLGGDNVMTNDPSSGVYVPTEDSTTENPKYEILEKYDEPQVDIQVRTLKIVGEDQHIYLGNNASLDDLLQSFSVYYDIVQSDGTTKISGRHKVDSILNHYVQLDFTLMKDTNDDGVGDVAYATYTINKAAQTGTWTYNSVTSSELDDAFTDDVTRFIIGYTATSSDSNKSVGSMTANIYVYKPEVTFQDSRHQYQSDATADNYYNTNNLVNGSLKWYNTTLQKYSSDAKVIDAETNQEVSAMLGTEPTLTYTFDPASTTWIENGKVTTTECVPVNVTEVVIDGDNVITINATTNADKGYLKTNRNVYTCSVCNNVDGTTTPTNVASDTIPEFVIHVYDVTGSLQITKTVQNNTIYASEMTDDAFEFTVTLTGENIPDTVSYKIGEKVYPNIPVNEGKFTVTLKNGESALISDIVSGIQYSVAETKKTGYTIQYDEYQSGTIAAQQTQATVVTNTYTVGSLTIKKEGMAQGETAIFTVTGDGKTYTVAITMGADGKGSATIGQLKLDTSYTVAEMTDWSWRYTSTPISATAEIAEAKNYQVSFQNTKQTDKWLSDESSIVNFDDEDQ